MEQNDTVGKCFAKGKAYGITEGLIIAAEIAEAQGNHELSTLMLKESMRRLDDAVRD